MDNFVSKHTIKLQKLRKQMTLVAFTVIFSIFYNCSTKPFYKNFSCKISDLNALRLSVYCETDGPTDVYVEYWTEKGGKHLFSNLSTQSLRHSFELIDLLSGEQYRLRLHGRIGNKQYESDAGIIHTDSLPGNLPSFKVMNDQFKFDGYILLKTFLDSGAYMLINDEAQIVWYESYDTMQLRPFEWVDDHIVSIKNKTNILEFDLHSKLYHQLDITSGHGNKIAHHEVIKNGRGNYLFLTKEIKRVDLTSYGGIKNDSIVGDGIMEMNPEGQIIWEWNIFDVANPMETDDFFRAKRDWGHANSLAYAEDGNFLVSFRDFNQIWKIDSKTGKVLWRFGLGGDFLLKPEDIFQRQHTAHINDRGDLLIFDNGTAKRGYSSVKAFTMDERNKTCHATINIKLGKDLFTARMGSGYLIDDEHVLVCSPMKNVTLAIYDMAGNEVWKAEGSMPSYRALYTDAGDIENARPF